MRILKKDLRKGMVKIIPQSIDDLWHLYNIISSGDSVYALTFRAEERDRERLRPEKMEKKPVWIGVRVERVEWHEFSDRLRLHGKIITGEDEGNYHTLNITQNKELEIGKEKWSEEYLSILKESVDRSNMPVIAIICLDEDESTIAILRQYGVQIIANVYSHRTGKMYVTTVKEEEKTYFEQIIRKIRDLNIEKNIENIVVSGPGFARDTLYKYMRDRTHDLKFKVHTVATAHPGTVGIHEVIKSGILDSIVKEERISMETGFVEELFTQIAMNGAYTYGRDDVEKAAEVGAIETILISNELIRKGELSHLLKKVKDAKGRIIVVSSYHDAGKRLAAIGGIGALLRYKLK